MSYLAFANITEILGKPDLAAHYRGKVGAIDAALNTLFLDNETGVYAASGVRSFGRHPSPDAGVVEGGAVSASALAYFCGESGTNAPPNPGEFFYQTLSLECPGSTIGAPCPVAYYYSVPVHLLARLRTKPEQRLGDSPLLL